MIVQLLAAGDTVPEISDKLKKSPSTIKRLMRDHSLRREANDLKAARANKIAARLAAETDGAVDVLVGNLGHDNPVVQNSSATKLLDQALRFARITGPEEDMNRDYVNDMIRIYRDAFSVFMEHAQKAMTDEQFDDFVDSLYIDKHLHEADELRKVLSAELDRREPL